MSVVLQVEIKRERDPAGLSIHLQSAALLPHLPSSPPSSFSLSLFLSLSHTHTPLISILLHHSSSSCSFPSLSLSLSLLLPLSFPLSHPLSPSLLLLFLLSSSLSLVRAQLHSFTCAEAQHWQWFRLVSNLQLVRTEGLEPCQQRCYSTVSKQNVTPFLPAATIKQSNEGIHPTVCLFHTLIPLNYVSRCTCICFSCIFIQGAHLVTASLSLTLT